VKKTINLGTITEQENLNRMKLSIIAEKMSLPISITKRKRLVGFFPLFYSDIWQLYLMGC